MKKTILNTAIIIVAMIIIVLIASSTIIKSSPVSGHISSQPKIIIDAGHGGEDGGAIGYDGIIEKDINLAISQFLRDICVINGYDVIMTRNSDISIYDEGNNTLRKKKISDMKNRLKMTQDNPDAIFVSVHQNIFAKSKYNGAQIFYSPNNPKSKELGLAIQQSFQNLLQPENDRAQTKAGKELYLLYKSQIPSVMVECGFISNPDEAKMLSTPEYQKKVALTIFDGISKFINQNK